MTCQTITITASAVGLKIQKCQDADTHWDGGLVGGGGDRRKDDHNMGAWLQRGGGGAGKARRLARERAWSWLPLLAMMLCWCDDQDDDGDAWKWGWRDDWRGLGGKKGWKGGFGNLALKLKTRFPSSLAAPCWDHDDDEEADNWTVDTLSRFTRQEVLCCSGLTFMKDKGHCAGSQHKLEGGCHCAHCATLSPPVSQNLLNFK